MDSRTTSARPQALRGLGRAGWLVVSIRLIFTGDLSAATKLNGFAEDAFTRITDSPAVTDQKDSVSAAWADYDNDGDLDLVVTAYSGQDEMLYRNDGNDRFTEIFDSPLVTAGRDSHGVAWGDYDNDGYLDVLVANRNGQNNRLYRNTGGGNFTLVNPSPVNAPGNSLGTTWVDYNNDGFVDLFIGNGYRQNFLYRNWGGVRFEPAFVSQQFASGDWTSGGAWADYDQDGDLDVFLVVAGNVTPTLFQDVGNGIFQSRRDVGFARELRYSQSAAWGDYDNDGDFDLFIANRLSNNLLYRQESNGTFDQVGDDTVSQETGDSNAGVWADFDNDGWLDLFVANGTAVDQNNSLYRNNRNGFFSRTMDGPIVSDGGSSTGAAVGDYNRDGFLDIFVANWRNGNDFLYRNSGNSNHWLIVQCIGRVSNRAGIGAQLQATTRIEGQLITQVRQIGGSDGWGNLALEAHFGLGDATSVATLKIRWPSGRIQILSHVAANQVLRVTEMPLNEIRQAEVTIPPASFALLTLPLVPSDNSIAAIFAGAPPNTRIFLFLPESQTYAVYTKNSQGLWTGENVENIRLQPGQGFWVKNESPQPMRVTFAGTLIQNPQGVALRPGLHLIGFQFPAGGYLESELHFPGQVGDVIYTFNKEQNHFRRFVRRDSGRWTPFEPRLEIGEAFFHNPRSPGQWQQTAPAF